MKNAKIFYWLTSCLGFLFDFLIHSIQFTVKRIEFKGIHFKQFKTKQFNGLMFWWVIFVVIFVSVFVAVLFLIKSIIKFSMKTINKWFQRIISVQKQNFWSKQKHYFDANKSIVFGVKNPIENHYFWFGIFQCKFFICFFFNWMHNEHTKMMSPFNMMNLNLNQSLIIKPQNTY